MKKVFRIKPDGSVEGLWSDELAGLGKAKVQRASRVEYQESREGWSVEFLIGPLKGSCLMDTFRRRKDALEAEVRALNEQIIRGELKPDFA
jgi:hypothetical protein